jgi:hypothetical protein
LRGGDKGIEPHDDDRIEDITDLVREQRARVNTDALETPVENVYPCLPSSPIGADSWP